VENHSIRTTNPGNNKWPKKKSAVTVIYFTIES
jgi:hypothetical protein